MMPTPVAVLGSGVDDTGRVLTGVINPSNTFVDFLDFHWALYAPGEPAIPITMSIVLDLPVGWIVNSMADGWVTVWDFSSGVGARPASAGQYRVAGTVFVPYSLNTGSLTFMWAASTNTPGTSFARFNGATLAGSSGGSASSFGASVTIDALSLTAGYNFLEFVFDHNGADLGFRLNAVSTLMSTDTTSDQVVSGVSGIAAPDFTGSGSVSLVPFLTDQLVAGVVGIPSREMFSGVGAITTSLDGATGIQSALAFGVGGNVGVNLVDVFGSAGIESALAFGAGGGVAIAGSPYAAGANGIPSTLAFGVGGQIYPANEGEKFIFGIAGIPSGEAFTEGPAGVRINEASVPRAMFVAF